MARLIDADGLKEVITQDWFLDILLTQTGKHDMAKKLVDMIDSVPLAYDVDAVVEELEDAKNDCGFIRATVEANSYCKALSKAIEIVRRGGVE